MNRPVRFRKKPVVIEAMQWDGTVEGVTPIIDWILDAGTVVASFTKEGVLRIETLEGTMSASTNDYIIKGVQGEFYPCKPDIFEATYELAEGTE